MAYIDLTVADVAGIRRVLNIDDQDFSQGVRSCLLALTRLIPCESAAFAIGDREGYVELVVTYPDGHEAAVASHAGRGPWSIGVHHLASQATSELRGIGSVTNGYRDILRVGFGLGAGRVAQVCFTRRASAFDARSVELLSMLEPALRRVLRPHARGATLALLSQAERRVLDLVAQGGSNRDIAAELSLSEATVRKHLENTYRKLGVANRTAAAALVLSGALASSADPLIPG